MLTNAMPRCERFAEDRIADVQLVKTANLLEGAAWPGSPAATLKYSKGQALSRVVASYFAHFGAPGASADARRLVSRLTEAELFDTMCGPPRGSDGSRRRRDVAIPRRSRRRRGRDVAILRRSRRRRSRESDRPRRSDARGRKRHRDARAWLSTPPRPRRGSSAETGARASGTTI